jgi:hypothetical protein
MITRDRESAGRVAVLQRLGPLGVLRHLPGTGSGGLRGHRDDRLHASILLTDGYLTPG